MGKVLLGRYIPGSSLVHRMDSRSKLILSFFFIVIIFLANNWESYLLLFIVTITSILTARVNFSFFIKGVRPLIWLILFTVLLQIFFSSGGTVFWKWGPFTLSYYGIVNGIYVFCRFVLIIFMSTLLTLTTAPLEIADALEKLMMPLKRIKVPVYEISLMLSIALRFVPTLMDETTKIMNAQRSRGVNFGEGNIMQQIKAVVPLLVPLFVSSFNRAEDLATAMEARGYHGGEGRTKYRVHYWEIRDTLGCTFFVVVFIILLFIRQW
ncbi:energy-coupling factor transporter transmembrane component T family protein [Liquorilactobacillus cacaonum]|uniref:energy-coupling factor transporter transmembrane component T family protein n=1 Tax=Liquorilactobacillus cacaonum TaxID=483012 RepID=UPI000710DA79|nr:energy-coupling factor transporter transmembrane protein EcfT [Liquorilactobacillus cacaonum]